MVSINTDGSSASPHLSCNAATLGTGSHFVCNGGTRDGQDPLPLLRKSAVTCGGDAVAPCVADTTPPHHAAGSPS